MAAVHSLDHEGCWFCGEPVCDVCPEMADRHEVLRRDAWVTACPDCAGVLVTVVEPNPACRECGAPDGRECFDTCQGWREREREDLAAYDDEVAHETRWGGAA